MVTGCTRLSVRVVGFLVGATTPFRICGQVPCKAPTGQRKRAVSPFLRFSVSPEKPPVPTQALNPVHRKIEHQKSGTPPEKSASVIGVQNPEFLHSKLVRGGNRSAECTRVIGVLPDEGACGGLRGEVVGARLAHRSGDRLKCRKLATALALPHCKVVNLRAGTQFLACKKRRNSAV